MMAPCGPNRSTPPCKRQPTQWLYMHNSCTSVIPLPAVWFCAEIRIRFTFRWRSFHPWAWPICQCSWNGKCAAECKRRRVPVQIMSPTKKVLSSLVRLRLPSQLQVNYWCFTHTINSTDSIGQKGQFGSWRKKISTDKVIGTVRNKWSRTVAFTVLLEWNWFLFEVDGNPPRFGLSVKGAWVSSPVSPYTTRSLQTNPSTVQQWSLNLSQRTVPVSDTSVRRRKVHSTSDKVCTATMIHFAVNNTGHKKFSFG